MTLPFPPHGASPAPHFAQALVVPVLPTDYYRVNGIILETQPTICTAPQVSFPLPLGVGSTFTLIFDTPSPATQALLVDQSQVNMTFALPASRMATGRVQLATTFSTTNVAWALRAFGPPVALSQGAGGPSTLVVTCILLASPTLLALGSFAS